MTQIDIKASDDKRAKDYMAMLFQATSDLDSTLSEAERSNIRSFLLHLAWHEGARLTARRQIPTGPGRGFSQFEPARAAEAVAYAEQKHLAGKLASVGGTTEANLKAARLAITGNSWPADGLIEQLLTGNDLFNGYLTRVALKKLPEAIPQGNDQHAKYWADHWKCKFSSTAEREKQVKIVKKSSDEVDGLL